MENNIAAAKQVARQSGDMGCNLQVTVLRQVARITGVVVGPRSKKAEEILAAYRAERHAMYEEKVVLQRLERAFSC